MLRVAAGLVAVGLEVVGQGSGRSVVTNYSNYSTIRIVRTE